MRKYLETDDGDLISVSSINHLHAVPDGRAFVPCDSGGSPRLIDRKLVHGLILKDSFEEVKVLLLGDME